MPNDKLTIKTFYEINRNAKENLLFQTNVVTISKGVRTYLMFNYTT